MSKLFGTVMALSILRCGIIFAADPDSYAALNLSVNILNNTCTVDANLGTVDMGNFGLRDIRNHGGVSKTIPFTVELKDCGVFAKSANVSLQGVTIVNEPNVLALSNPNSESTAKNIGLQILDENDDVLHINESTSYYTYELTPGSDSVLKFGARYHLSGNNAAAGKADSEVTVLFSYN